MAQHQRGFHEGPNDCALSYVARLEERDANALSYVARHQRVRCAARSDCALSYAERTVVESSAGARTVAEARTAAEEQTVAEGQPVAAAHSEGPAIDGAHRYELRDSGRAAGRSCGGQHGHESMCAARRVGDFRVERRQCALSYEGQDRRACFGDSAARTRFAL